MEVVRAAVECPNTGFEADAIRERDRVFIERLRFGTVPAIRVCLSCLAGLTALLLFSPLLVLTYLLVKITSRGPVIYRQTRIGLNGESFELYKFRTMVLNAEAASGPVWSKPNDPRITFVGRWLRTLHIDELPQLVNVVKGEMALVGPRPERPEIARQLHCEIPGFGKRLAVRPGITGLAQINFPADTDNDSFRRKLLIDMDYVANASLLLDIRIVIATAPRFLGLESRLVRRLLGVYRYIPQSLERDFLSVCRSDREETSPDWGEAILPFPTEEERLKRHEKKPLKLYAA